jgi:class 3 adenylate cyclase
VKTETLTMMIVDLVGSTQLVEAASRQQLVDLMEDITVPIRKAVAEYSGNIVKFTGDGYLVTFQSASEALHAAAQVVESFAAQPTLPSGARLEGCRVVLHTSDVILDKDDVLGEGVVIAARLEKHVPTNQIYLTSTVREVAKSAEFEFELIGDFPLKGLVQPIKVYRLSTESFSGIEHGVYLMITDLIGMSKYMTEVPIELVNRTMQRWIALQREAISQVGGRLRAIVGDNLVTSYLTADSAVDAMLRLETLVSVHNDSRGDMPRFEYTGITCKGDLFVLSIGVNGPLVGHTFRMLDLIKPGEKAIEEPVFIDLSRYRERFAKRATQEALYYYVVAK